MDGFLAFVITSMYIYTDWTLNESVLVLQQGQMNLLNHLTQLKTFVNWDYALLKLEFIKLNLLHIYIPIFVEKQILLYTCELIILILICWNNLRFYNVKRKLKKI